LLLLLTRREIQKEVRGTRIEARGIRLCSITVYRQYVVVFEREVHETNNDASPPAAREEGDDASSATTATRMDGGFVVVVGWLLLQHQPQL